MPDGSSVKYELTGDNYITRVEYGDGSIWEQSELDKLGRITKITKSDGYTETREYDLKGRLKTVTKGNTVIGYEYDVRSEVFAGFIQLL